MREWETLGNTFRSPTYSAKARVKPSNRKTPRQSSTIAWRISYAPTVILDTEIESPEQSGLLFLTISVELVCFQIFADNLFEMIFLRGAIFVST
jgi:hypothetical protein